VLDISRDRLKAAPAASESDTQTWTSPEWINSVYRYYEVRPYWESDTNMNRNRNL
jgi:hypothetical protein